jgi:hypothetical protein
LWQSDEGQRFTREHCKYLTGNLHCQFPSFIIAQLWFALEQWGFSHLNSLRLIHAHIEKILEHEIHAQGITGREGIISTYLHDLVKHNFNGKLAAIMMERNLKEIIKVAVHTAKSSVVIN